MISEKAFIHNSKDYYGEYNFVEGITGDGWTTPDDPDEFELLNLWGYDEDGNKVFIEPENWPKGVEDSLREEI